MSEILTAKRLSKSFGSVNAVKDVEFTLNESQFVALVGASGSGKSTLLALLGGLEKPSSGEVYLVGNALSTQGEDDLALMRRDNIGIVFQSFNLIPTLNALDNVAFPLFPVKLPLQEKKQRAVAALESVGLAHRASHLPSELSGGERQRVAIARALVNNPKIILADEPTGNLDSTTGQDIIGLLVSLSKEKGMALLVATHDQELARLADEIIIMRDGEINEQA
jgi:putative ABC transport system ATP-binding protein